MPVAIDDIFAAQERIRGAVTHSPCPYSLLLSKLCGCDIFCKLETVQVTGSFKERGARNTLVQLSDDAKRRGVIAASAGNHALGLAYHGQALGIPVTVVMPKSAPLTKVANCRGFGANVIQFGDSFEDALARAEQLRDEKNLTYVHGFNDPAIIAGQGTVGLEILEDVPDVDAVIIPVGGGGLIAGAAVALKSLKPAVRVIGVESENAPTLSVSRAAGKSVAVKPKATLADGLAIAEIGTNCREPIARYVDGVVLVNEEQIARSVLRLMEMEKVVVEGAGATPLAAAMTGELGLEGKKVVLLLAGGNIDLTTIGHIIDRGLAADGRLCRIVVKISDRPGGLARLAAVLAESGASVKEIAHDRYFGSTDVASVRVVCVLETRDFAHVDAVRHAIAAAGIELDNG